ncbi:hypothetical protein GIB67_005451 [Kingdonia uniflora]|uniref:Protein kinase domain-containing protein n=1 Tax=Kingdonia uniflora TaxID=39325 RepID=A0A7J7NH85_9MAGN|nr:hypothetical protein GIB67_005451 [Kingdonia uniflora]
MAIFLLLQSLSSLLFLFLTSQVTAQTPNTTDFSCSFDSSNSCQTYIAYRAQTPDFLDLGNISDLFGTSRKFIKQASNLSSEEDPLNPDQLLLIPIPCSCTNKSFFATITYQINKDDSFYSLSIHAFENLTEYHRIIDLNPTLIPTLLHIGVEVVVPVFCKCPTKSQLDKGLKFIITYVWQSHDDLQLLSRRLNASSSDIVTENNYRNFSAAAGSPVLIPVAELPVLFQPAYSPPPLGKKSKPRQIILVASCSVGAALVSALLCSVIYIYCICYRQKLVEMDLIPKRNFRAKISKISSPRAIQDKLLPGVSGYLGKAIIYEAKILMEATMNLNEHYRIGGSVYKATINGEVFAIKKTKEDVTEESRILQKVNHGNLVKLIGISTVEDGDCFLVYEFAENGSLDRWLSSVTFLTWSQRLNIALDIANGLHYMHEHTQPSIVHMDIRSSNILLDSKFKAKIANFSKARTAKNPLMLKADVFAFGVVLLELLSGKKAMETREGGEIVMLWKEIKEILEVEGKREERLRKWMDPNLEKFYPIDGALSLAAMAKACTWDKSSARPSMSEMVFNLSVLTQTSSETLDRSWTNGLEADESIQVIGPVRAR